jgi:hypothetical protein
MRMEVNATRTRFASALVWRIVEFLAGVSEPPAKVALYVAASSHIAYALLRLPRRLWALASGRASVSGTIGFNKTDQGE